MQFSCLVRYADPSSASSGCKNLAVVIRVKPLFDDTANPSWQHASTWLGGLTMVKAELEARGGENVETQSS